MRRSRLFPTTSIALAALLLLALTVLATSARGDASAALAGLMPAYDDARGALAADSLGDLAQPARDLRRAIAALDQDLTADAAGVPAEKLGEVRALLPALRSASGALVSASELPAARDAFAALSKSLIAWRKLAGDGPDIAFCPMLNRYWLQPHGTPVENPYGGRSMAGCGEVMPAR